MSLTDHSQGPTQRQMRVLVVENSLRQRADHVQLLELWGYQPVIAEGAGDALLLDAKYKAQRYRCQLALVDMRLRNDYDSSDISGLELAPELLPTVSIIVSGIDDRRKAVEAVLLHKAANFICKHDGPEVLQAAIEGATQPIRAGAEITWPANLSSDEIMNLLIGDSNAPGDEADELLRRMFPDARRISLEPITLPPSRHERGSAIRRRSLVCKMRQDENQAVLVIKISRKDRIANEIENYGKYIELQLRGQFVPVMHKHKVLWDIGAVAYRFIGNSSANDPDGPATFRIFYRGANAVPQIMAPLEHFFDRANWGEWFQTDIRRMNENLFDAYDLHWRHALASQLPAWRTQEALRSYPGLGRELPNPASWLARNYRTSGQIPSRLAVTHGDLQGENLFVDYEGHAWPIDFERTGPGPILRDFVELIHDIITHLSQIKKEELPLLYELAVAVCEPRRPGQPMRATDTVAAEPRALKALQVIDRIQHLAHERTGYSDQRELLWGLLLNSMFVATIVPENRGRYLKTLLLASVIIGRLEHWDGHAWPPPGWPPVRWPDSSEPGPPAPAVQPAPAPPPAAGFAQGHALLIGVGEYPRLGHSLATIANDAAALAQALADPALAAYPPEQVKLLGGGAATRGAILRALDALALQVRAAPQATVLLLFGGHGKQIDDRYVLLPSDYDPADPAGTTIDSGTLRQKVDAIARHAQKLVVLLNCCYSGGVGDGVLDPSLGAPAPPPAFYAPLAEGSGRVIITSAQPGERAGAESSDDPRFSVFGAQLLAGLRGAAPGDGAHVMILDLFRFLSAQVPADAQTITDPATGAPLDQHPELYARALGRDFAITLRPPAPEAARGRASAAPPRPGA